MRGNCVLDDVTNLYKPCVYNGNPAPLTDPSAIDILNDLCPDLAKGKEKKYLNYIIVILFI